MVEVEEKEKKVVLRGSRKRGKPPTSGKFYYVEFAAKKQVVIELRKKEQELDRYEKLKALSSEDLYTSMKLDLDTAVEDMKMNPTPDVASRARESLDEVLRVARISRNLNGGCVKALKQAAVLSTATVEVLRTRADDKLDKLGADVSRQIRTLGKELEKARREAKESQEEMKRMRLELEEMKRTKERMGRARVIRDSPSPEPKPREEIRLESTPPEAKKAVEEPTGRARWQQDSSSQAMEIDVPEGTESKKGRKILPPPEEWPPAIRPTIQGKVKVIEDCILVDKVKIVDKEGDSKRGMERKKTGEW